MTANKPSGLSYLNIAATVLLCALAPMTVADWLRSSPWDFNQPPWSWSLIAILPLAALIASLLISRIPKGFWRIFAIVVALHALFVIVLKWRGLWPIFCGAMLWSDALLFVAVLPAVIAQRSPRWAGASTMFWTGLFFGVGVIFGYAEELIISRAAENIAGDLPYCIQTASQANAFDYEEARSLFDLNGLKMRVRQGYCGMSECFISQNHAILAVEGPAYYHWSYGGQSFVPEHMPGPRCKLKPHFALQLPAW